MDAEQLQDYENDAPGSSKAVRFEEENRHFAMVVSAFKAGALAGAFTFAVWAVAALSSAHLPGTWLAQLGAPLASFASSGGLLSGGDGLGAGAIPLFPVLVLSLAAVAALRASSARSEGKVVVRRAAGASIGRTEGDDSAPARESKPCTTVVPVSPLMTWTACMSAGAVAAALPWLLPAHPAFGVLVAGAILGLLLTRPSVTRNHDGGNKLAVLLTGLTTLIGVWTIETLASHAWLEGLLPAPIPLITYGAALGGFMVLGTAAAHVSVGGDPVKALWRRASSHPPGELRYISRKGHDTYRSVEKMLLSRAGHKEQAHRLLERLSLVTCRVLELAIRCREIDEATGDGTVEKLTREIEELDRTIEGTTDEVARRQYERARETLSTQKSLIERIRVGRERAVATMHSQLAHLERARLSLIGLESSDSGRLMAELSMLSESLEGASAAMDEETSAMLSIHDEVSIRTDPRPSSHVEEK